jgi:DNA polymerase III epsilon subunit-like protein
MQVAKAVFGFSHLKLDYVCRQLEIALHHHDAESDARAAAYIIIKAAERLGAASTNQLFEFVRAKHAQPCSGEVR